VCSLGVDSLVFACVMLVVWLCFQIFTIYTVTSHSSAMGVYQLDVSEDECSWNSFTTGNGLRHNVSSLHACSVINVRFSTLETKDILVIACEGI